MIGDRVKILWAPWQGEQGTITNIKEVEGLDKNTKLWSKYNLYYVHVSTCRGTWLTKKEIRWSLE